MAASKTLPLQLTLPPQQSKTARLQNVEAGSTVTLAARADCELWLDLKRQDNGSRVFAAKMPLEWSTVLLISEAGEYMLYFHNRSDNQCGFEGELTARLDSAATGSVNQQLKRLSDQLQKVFIMDPIDYQLVDCGSNSSYAQGSKVLICREHLEHLQEAADDNEMARSLVFFTVMHETSHVLLTQWQYPFNNNEDVVDEFGVVLTRLMKQDAVITDQADYFEQQPSQAEYEHILKNDDRHTLSIQRARNLRGWAEDSALLTRWMPVLIPHIHSDQLETMRNSKNVELAQRVEVELESRQLTANQ